MLLAAMQEEFATLSGNMAKIISEAFKSVKADLEISYDEIIQEEYILNARASSPPPPPPPAKQNREETNGKSQKYIVTTDLVVLFGPELLGMSYPPSNESKRKGLAATGSAKGGN